MAFPTNLTNAVDGVTQAVAAHINNLEAKVGIDGSAVPTSLDYLIKSAEDPGHTHTGSDFTAPVNVTFANPITFDFSTGLWLKTTLTGATAITLSNLVAGVVYTLELIQGGSGGYAPTWTTTISWVTAQHGLDLVVGHASFFRFVSDGSTIYGAGSENLFAAIGNMGATRTLDFSLYGMQSATLDQACALTLTPPSNPGPVQLILTNGGAFTITWSTTVEWPGGAAPSWTASGIDIITFIWNGTAWYGVGSLAFA